MSARPELSKSQRELFDAIESGVRVVFSPYAGRFNPNEYYRRMDNYKRVTAAARALLKKGLVEKADKDWRGHTLKIKS